MKRKKLTPIDTRRNTTTVWRNSPQEEPLENSESSSLAEPTPTNPEMPSNILQRRNIDFGRHPNAMPFRRARTRRERQESDDGSYVATFSSTSSSTCSSDDASSASPRARDVSPTSTDDSIIPDAPHNVVYKPTESEHLPRNLTQRTDPTSRLTMNVAASGDTSYDDEAIETSPLAHRNNPLASAPLVFRHDDVPSPYFPSYDDSLNPNHNPVIASVQHYFDKLYKSLDREDEKKTLFDRYRKCMTKLDISLHATPNSSTETLELLTIKAKKSLYQTYLNIMHNLESVERFQRRALDRHLFEEIFEEKDDKLPRIRNEDPYAWPQEKPIDVIQNWWLLIVYNVRNFFIMRFCPWLFWITAYRPRFIPWDVLAGVVTGTLCIAQGLAFGLVAGLPPVYGLYCALVPPLVYMYFGFSPHISVGPSVIPSLLIGQSVQDFDRVEDRISYALMISFFNGCLLFLWGMFNLGFIVNFFAGSIMLGFQTAVAILIIIGQLRNILGVEAPRADTIQEVVVQFFTHIDDADWPSPLIAFSCIAIVLFFQHFRLKIRKHRFAIVRFPYQLLVLGLAILVVFLISRGEENQLDREVYGTIKIVGEVMSGLPTPRLPTFEFLSEYYPKIILDTVTVSFLTVIITITVARRFASLNQYEIDYSQEIYALGMCHLIGCLFQAYPHAAGFGRSVTHGGIAKSQLSNILISFIIFLTVLFALPLFYYLPVAALAAIVIITVSKLIAWREIWYTFKVRKTDFLTLLISFLVTLFAGVVYGVVAAAVFSFFLLLFRSTRPHITLMGRVIGTSRFASARFYKGTMHIPGILVVRFDADLYFVNASYLEDFIDKRIKNRRGRVWAVILDCESLSHIDTSGVTTLQRINRKLHLKHIMFLIAHMKFSIQEIIKRSDPQFSLIHETQYFPLVYVAQQEAIRARNIQVKERERRRKEMNGELILSPPEDDPLFEALLDQDYTRKFTSDKTEESVAEGHGDRVVSRLNGSKIKTPPDRNEGLIRRNRGTRRDSEEKRKWRHLRRSVATKQYWTETPKAGKKNLIVSPWSPTKPAHLVSGDVSVECPEELENEARRCAREDEDSPEDNDTGINPNNKFIGKVLPRRGANDDKEEPGEQTPEEQRDDVIDPNYCIFEAPTNNLERKSPQDEVAKSGGYYKEHDVSDHNRRNMEAERDSVDSRDRISD